MDPLEPSSAPAPLSPPRPPDVGPFGLGALRALARDPLDFFIETARRCGDVARFELAGVPVFQLTHPEHNYQVLVERQRAFRKSQRVKRVLGQWSGDGLALIDGEAWARQRRSINPSFRNERIACHVAVVARHARALVEDWRGQHEIDVSEAVSRLTLRVVAEALFGADVESYTEDFSGHLAVLNECAVRELGSLLPLPLWAPTPQKRRLRASTRYLDELVYGMIARCRAESGERSHLLYTLLHTVDESGHAMTDREAHDAMVSLLLGGNETTATGIVWALHCLARHPEIQRDVRSEVVAALAGSEPNALTLRKLPRLAQVLAEALRLYPPVYALPREAALDVELSGVHVPAGSIVNLVPFITQRDPRWFERPELFIPQRFEREHELRRGAYLPFGMGRRLCVGHSFAVLESLAILATILERFELRPASDSPDVELEAQISLHPRGGLRLALEPARG